MKMKATRIIVLSLICCITSACSASVFAQQTITVDQVRDVRELKSLPKPVYSWAVHKTVWDLPNAYSYLRECARIAGSIGVDGLYTEQELLLVKALAISAGVGITLQETPLHRTGHSEDPEDWRWFEKELNHLQNFFKLSLELEMPVNAIVLSTEQFKVLHPLNTARQDLFYAVAKNFYPEVSVYGYRTACWKPNSEVDTDVKTVRWYSPHKAIQTELRFNRYYDPEFDRWAVWLSFGWGYDPLWKKLDIDPVHWIHLGRRFAADERIEAAIIFPGLGGSNAVPLADFHEAFCLFVRGATDKN